MIERERISAAAASGRPIRDKRGQRRVALSNESINKTLVLLANIVDTAVVHGLLASNPARGTRRRLKADRPTRRFLEADELAELLAVAGELDRSARSDQRIGRRPLIAVMAKSGLRVGEVCALRWRSVDTAHQRFVIEHAKTAAGIREVDLSLDVVEELNAWRAERKPASVDEFVFATDSGRPRDKDSVRERVLVPVVKRVNEIRAERGIAALPKVTPHALRRTYISLMLEAGAPLPYVMDQVGHADSKTTLEIYAQVQKRTSRENVHAAFGRLLKARTATSPQLASERRTKRLQRGTLAARSAMFDGPRRPCWATLWATEATRSRAVIRQLTTNPCKSIWARLGLNQRPLACEASALPLSYAPKAPAILRVAAAPAGPRSAKTPRTRAL
jgi:integrase